MATATFDPFREFERLFTGVATPQSSNLSMDLYKKGDVFVAEIDMPGVDPASIDIDIDDRTLTVRAERSSVSGEDIEWLTRERRNGAIVGPQCATLLLHASLVDLLRASQHCTSTL